MGLIIRVKINNMPKKNKSKNISKTDKIIQKKGYWATKWNEMPDGDKTIMKWFIIPFIFVLPVVVLLWYSITGGGAGNKTNNHSSGADWLVNYHTTNRSGGVYVKCIYQSGRTMYVKYFMDGSNQKWKNWGCKDDLNN